MAYVSPSPSLPVNINLNPVSIPTVKHQASVAEQVMYGLQTVTGQPNVSITRRSFFLFWFMSQISRYTPKHVFLL